MFFADLDEAMSQVEPDPQDERAKLLASVVLPPYLLEAVNAGDVDILDLPDGVYFDLPPLVYFAQKRLGSSDQMTLHKRREGWWWKSPHNPLLPKEADNTDARTYGSGLHTILLEGVPTYQARFMVEPDPASYPGVLAKTEELRQALEGMPGYVLPKGISKWKLADWEAEAEAMLDPTRFTVWGPLVRAFKRSLRPGVEAISATDDATLRILHRAAFETDTPEGQEVARLLSDDPSAPAMAEVTVFWTDKHGLRRRARIDRMYPKFDMDLKSMRGHWSGRQLDLVVDDVIRREGYDIQRADYHTARRMVYAFVVAGMDEFVQGGTAEQRAWLATWPDKFPRWDWVWLFYQKPDMVAGQAPIIFPLYDEARSHYHVHGLRKGVRALDLYRECVHRFGLDQPWVRIEPTHYTNPDYVPHVLTYPDNSPEAKTPLDDEDALLGG